ncbi:MAG TPA: hypothetical protein VMK31_02195 [Sphingomicrobium sp.]|nr:hypothetical protein [Sphingomicrobium sp.]
MTLFDDMFRRPFPLAHFEPAPMEFDEQSRDEELPASPTAGELCKSIERHLGCKAGGDPVEELRNALAELRRSLA